MSTTANTTTGTTTTPVVVTTADSKVVASIASYVKAQNAVDSGYNNIAKEVIKVAARMGLSTSEQVSTLIRLSFFEQNGMGELPDDNADKAAYADSIRSDVSNLTTLSLPREVKKDGKVQFTVEQLVEARDKAFAYNDKLPKDCRRNLRIGQKSMLAIVRGQEDVDNIIGVKEGRIKPVDKAAAATPTSAADTGSASSSPANGSGSVTSQQGDANSPEQQQAAVPGATISAPTEGEKPIGNPRDLLRATIRTMKNTYTGNLGLTLDVFREIVTDELSKLA